MEFRWIIDGGLDDLRLCNIIAMPKLAGVKNSEHGPPSSATDTVRCHVELCRLIILDATKVWGERNSPSMACMHAAMIAPPPVESSCTVSGKLAGVQNLRFSTFLPCVRITFPSFLAENPGRKAPT